MTLDMDVLECSGLRNHYCRFHHRVQEFCCRPIALLVDSSLPEGGMAIDRMESKQQVVVVAVVAASVVEAEPEWSVHTME